MDSVRRMTHPARWIDQQTADLLSTDTAIREAIRKAKYLPPEWSLAEKLHAGPVATPLGRCGPRITISVREARTMLRAALPAPLAPFRGRARTRHAELVTALSLFTSHLAALAGGDNNSVHQASQHTIGSALILAEALKAWTAEMRWREATKSAKKRWPRAPETTPAADPITAVMRQQAQPEPEQMAITSSQAPRRRAAG